MIEKLKWTAVVLWSLSGAAWIGGIAFLVSVYGWEIAPGILVVFWASNMERSAKAKWASYKHHESMDRKMKFLREQVRDA